MPLTATERNEMRFYISEITYWKQECEMARRECNAAFAEHFGGTDGSDSAEYIEPEVRTF